MDFRVNNDIITRELYNFVITGNGILTGLPGAGKSYEIDKLINYLQEKEFSVLFLPVDKLVAESDIDLENELDLKTNLFEYIASDDKVSPTKKGIIIIDAFDAARSRNKRNFYLKLIRKIIAKLNDEWNVLVVVRIFDAKKSSDLLNLFPNSFDTDQKLSLKILKTSKEIRCRHVILPELNLDDLNCILAEHPIISKFTYDINTRLKKLLFNPFYISLIIHLIQTEKNTIKINSVYSEVQLLDLYWNSRIECNQSGISYEILLKEFTENLIKTHSLSVPLSELANFSEDNIVYLLSSGIITTVGINKNKIAYAHNILFDYAVSRLTIDDRENGLINFISIDKSNIIFLKPSIRYYLTKIWYNDKDLFKKVGLKIYEADEVKIPLLAKIIPTQVLVQEADSVSDCEFLSSLYDKDSEYKDWLHATIFSTLVSFESEDSPSIPNKKFWLNYFEQVIQSTKNPNDFNIVSWLYKIQNDDKNSDIQCQIGRICRRILSTCLELRKNNQNIDKFASHLPEALVAKTFGSDPIQSRDILENLFEIADEDDYELSYLITLAYNIKEIFPFDQDFVSKFYDFIFSRTEESTKQTEMGSTGFFRLTSNRRQDFEGIRYHLSQESGALLDSDLRAGLRTLIKSINRGICRRHVLLYLQEGHSIQERIINFPFNRKESKFLEDFCYVWGNHDFHAESEFEMRTQIKDRIIKKTENPDNKSALNIIIDEYGDHAIVAILWRDLIKIVSTNPEPFSSIILDLICAKPLQLHSETINEVAELIDASIRYISEEEICQIVNSILKNFEEIEDEDYKKYLQEKRNYLLSKIPLKFLPTRELKDIIKEHLKKGGAPPQKPIEISEVETRFVSEEEILESKKIDPNNSENKLILPIFFIVKSFNSKWINEKVSDVDALLILEPFKKLYFLIEDQNLRIPKNTIDYAWEELSRCAKIIANGLKQPNSELYNYSRKVLLKSATFAYTQKREKFTPDFDTFSWSPIPITDAAEGLVSLYSLDDDEEIWRTIDNLSRNEYPIIRMIIASDLVLLLEKHPVQFWKMLDEFIERENNCKIHEILCRNLNIAFKKKPECILDITKRFETISRKFDKIGTGGLGLINNNCFIASVSYFAFVNEIKWAKEFFVDVIQKPELYSTMRSRVVSLIINQFFKTPTIFNNKYDPARSSVSKWLNQILHSALDEIEQLLLTKQQLTDDDKKQFENHYRIIEEYITRLFFVVDKKYNKIEDPVALVQAIEKIYKSERNTLEFVLDSLLISDDRMVLRGDEMQYLMGILDSCMSQDPEKVLELTVKTLKFGHRIGYSSDYLGEKEIQNFIDHLLADHRDILEDKTVMNNFTDLLDNYARGNSPEAIKYIMSIDLEYH
jgi:hypothetical protein